MIKLTIIEKAIDCFMVISEDYIYINTLGGTFLIKRTPKIFILVPGSQANF